MIARWHYKSMTGCASLSQAVVCDVLKQPRFLLGMTQLKTEAVVDCWSALGSVSSSGARVVSCVVIY